MPEIKHIGGKGNKMFTNDMNPVLLAEIIKCKRKMYRKAKHLGFTHPSVVQCSQELDDLINKYQGIQ